MNVHVRVANVSRFKPGLVNMQLGLVRDSLRHVRTIQLRRVVVQFTTTAVAICIIYFTHASVRRQLPQARLVRTRVTSRRV